MTRRTPATPSKTVGTGTILIASVLLLGVVLIAVGRFTGNRVFWYAGLMFTLAGMFTEIQRLVLRSGPGPSILLVAATALFAGLGIGSTPLAASAQRYIYTGADSLHPRLKYADSLVSANDRCMVSQQKLNPKMRPVYVNGVPMGFC